MNACELVTIASDASFRFGCHPGVPCFNECCRDLNQALTPYDLVRLKTALKVSAREFISRYAAVHTGPATGLPVVSLRFADTSNRACPFVSPEGCRVYAHRPASCRIYPLARLVQRSREDGRLTEHYALLREPHCRGFQQNQSQNVAQWIAGQGLTEYNRMNDALMELIALKNRLPATRLTPSLRRWVQTALYDVDSLKETATKGLLPGCDDQNTLPLPALEPDPAEDAQWLLWGLRWIRSVLASRTADR
jgi:uncharacterized protein